MTWGIWQFGHEFEMGGLKTERKCTLVQFGSDPRRAGKAFPAKTHQRDNQTVLRSAVRGNSYCLLLTYTHYARRL